MLIFTLLVLPHEEESSYVSGFDNITKHTGSKEPRDIFLVVGDRGRSKQTGGCDVQFDV
jgi:hypothetical protein